MSQQNSQNHSFQFNTFYSPITSHMCTYLNIVSHGLTGALLVPSLPHSKSAGDSCVRDFGPIWHKIGVDDD